MTPLSQTILDRWQVRKSWKQKSDFIEFLSKEISKIRVEEGGFGKNRNLVVGDLSSAKIICTAHYDTCARMFMPNFLTPKNLAVYIAYTVVLCAAILALPFLCSFLIHILPMNELVRSFLLLTPSGIAIAELLLILCGPANPNTVNDNTSGVITLCGLIQKMTEDERRNVAFVFFDNEEKGMLGSQFFRKLHKQDRLESKLILNFDCVSDGDHMMTVMSKSAQTKWGSRIESAFPTVGYLTLHHFKSSNTRFPSDQKQFPMSVGIGAMKYRKFIGLYMNRIHTPKDTVMREENIDYLVEGTRRLTSLPNL